MGCSTADKKAFEEVVKSKIGELEALIEEGNESYYENGENIDSLVTEVDELRLILQELQPAPQPTNAEALKTALKGVLRVRFNGVSKIREEKIKRVNVTPDMATIVQTDKGTYTFTQGQDRSTDFSAKKVYVVVDGMGELTNKHQSIQDEIDNLNETLMAKSGTKKPPKDKFTQLEEDIHGNPEKMIDLLNLLNEKDKTPESEEHMEYLRGLIKQLNPEFIRKAKTFIMEGAVENGGMIEGKDIKILLGANERIARNQKSAAEVYTHELIHAYTKFAVRLAKQGDVEARKILRQLEHVKSVARENMTWKDLLPNKKEFTKEEEQEAKEMYDYIFDVNTRNIKDWKPHKNSEDEFMAHALTNPKMIEKLKYLHLKEDAADKSLWDRIKDMFATVASILSGEFKFSGRKKDLQALTLDLVGMFAEHNNRAVTKARKSENIMDRLTDTFNNLEDEAADKIRDLVNSVMPKDKRLGVAPTDKIGKAKWMAKAMVLMVTDPVGRKSLFLLLRTLGMPLYGSVASILRDFVESDEFEKSIDWLGLQADKIDQTKMNIMGSVKANINTAFKKQLTEEEENALTQVLLDTDLQSISQKYTNADLRKMMSSKEELHKEIGRVKHQLKELDPDNYNWNTVQASGLGYYMATGKGHKAQNVNARSIAKGHLSANYRQGWIRKRGDLEALIDTVATLTALENTDQRSKDIVAELLKNERKGVTTVLDTARFIYEDSKDTIFAGQQTFMIKGYSKELFDDSITVEIVELDKHQEMIDRGFKKVKDLEGDKSVTVEKKYGMYVSTGFETNEWHRAAVRLTKKHTKGTSLKELYYNEDTDYTVRRHKLNKIKIDAERLRIVKSINEGTFDPANVEYGLMPLLDDHGEVADYRYVMEKEAKRDLLKQDIRATEVLAATRGSVVDKGLSTQHNKSALKLIKEDAKENYIPGATVGKNAIPYILITEDSSNPMIADLWKVMPKEFKAEAHRNRYKGLPVREDMLVNFFGHRHMSVANIGWLKKITPGFIHKAIKIAEAIWMEFIKIAKVDILIKMPFVIVGNIISNIVYGITTGSGPLEILEMYKESIRDTRDYLVQHREAIKLGEKLNIGTITAKEKERLTELSELMKVNPVHELYELGVYQAIVEDVSQEELSSTNKLKKLYKDQTKAIPKVIKDGMNWIYLTEETKYYKFMSEVLQMSDLVARDVENRKFKKTQELQAAGKKPLPRWYIKHLETSKDDMAVAARVKYKVEDRKRAMSGEERKYFRELAAKYRHNYILNAFVYYNKPSGAMEEYLNQMGFIMFTKYAKRIQRVIANTATEYPIRSLMTVMVDGFLIDVDTIQGQSLFTRSWYNMTPQWPWERVLDVFTPPIVQASTYRVI